MQVESSIVIMQPLEDVFAFITDTEAQSQWQAATQENKKLTDGPVGVGTQIQHRGKFLGKRMESIAEVVEYEPNSKYHVKSVQGYLPVDLQYLLEPAEEGTKLILIAGGAPGDFFRLAEPLVAAASRRLIAADLRRLKAVLETRVKT